MKRETGRSSEIFVEKRKKGNGRIEHSVVSSVADYIGGGGGRGE